MTGRAGFIHMACAVWFCPLDRDEIQIGTMIP